MRIIDWTRYPAPSLSAASTDHKLLNFTRIHCSGKYIKVNVYAVHIKPYTESKL